jgi:DNA polymerase-3 subunit gamma/tau
VARRFRPRTFEEVVGQEETVKALRATLESGKVPHAFLFCGSRGVGKTTAARILARALNCERGAGSQPCGACERCAAILAETDPDVIEMDAASNNSVEDIRALREKAAYAPMRGRRKIYILDEAHMLSRAAFNAFLKVLEEPPPHVTFVLATTELHKIPDTIRSRCQVHVFRRVSEDAVVARLAQICAAERIEADPGVLSEIAVSCRGGLRDAESELERILPLLASEGTRFTPEEYRRMAGRVGLPRVAEAMEAILAGDGKAALAFAASVLDAGIDERECLGEVLEILRTLLHLRVDGPDTVLVRFSGELRERLAAMASATAVERLEAMIQVVLIGRDRIRHFDDRPLLLEVTLLRMIRAGEVPLLRELVERVEGGSGKAGPSRPVAAPAPAGTAGGGGLLARIRQAVAEQKPMLKDALKGCRLEVAADASVVRLVFEGLGKMHRDRLETESTRTNLRDLVRSLQGSPCAVELALEASEKEPAPAGSAGNAVPPPPEQPAEQPRAEPGPLAEKVRKRFDGRFLEQE